MSLSSEIAHERAFMLSRNETKQAEREAAKPLKHYNILGVDVNVATYNEAFLMIENALKNKQHKKVAFLNSHGANLAASDRLYRAVMGQFEVFSDGCGVDLAAKTLYGSMFPENLNGTDFVPSVIGQLKQPLKIGLLGAAPGIAEKAAFNMSKDYPKHTFVAISDGYFDADKEKVILQELAEEQFDIVLVAYGNPLQELWISKNCTSKHGTVFIAVGALLDFLSGNVSRAPKWMIKNRLEWAYRLCLEPSRMWKRYILGNPLFVLRMLKQKLFNKVMKTKQAHKMA